MIRIRRGVMVILLLSGCFRAGAGLCAEGKWPGIDDAVVQKIAREHGRDAKPLPFAPEGDLQLFVFLMAGAVGGFAAGYFWRMMMEGKGGGRGEQPKS